MGSHTSHTNGNILSGASMVAADPRKRGDDKRHELENLRPLECGSCRSFSAAAAICNLAAAFVGFNIRFTRRNCIPQSKYPRILRQKKGNSVCRADVSVAASVFFLQRRCVCPLLVLVQISRILELPAKRKSKRALVSNSPKLK